MTFAACRRIRSKIMNDHNSKKKKWQNRILFFVFFTKPCHLKVKLKRDEIFETRDFCDQLIWSQLMKNSPVLGSFSLRNKKRLRRKIFVRFWMIRKSLWDSFIKKRDSFHSAFASVHFLILISLSLSLSLSASPVSLINELPPSFLSLPLSSLGWLILDTLSKIICGLMLLPLYLRLDRFLRTEEGWWTASQSIFSIVSVKLLYFSTYVINLLLPVHLANSCVIYCVNSRKRLIQWCHLINNNFIECV